MSDRCGEKLHERHVCQAIGHAMRRAGIEPSFALLAPSSDDRSYTLFVAGRQPTDARAAKALGEHLETHLAANPQYAICRRLGQLNAVRVRIVDARSAHEGYVHRLRELGQRLGTIKPPSLDARTGWESAFRDPSTGVAS